MAFKKIFNSGVPVIINQDSGDSKLFMPGFSYRIGNIIYTVVEDATKEPHAPMRRVQLSDGSVEIMGIETIKKDIKQKDAQIITTGKETVKNEDVKKTAKKKSKKSQKRN